MEKKEKKSDLEGLLNSLIKKGWKPRGKNFGVIDFLGTLVFVDLNIGMLSNKNALDLRKLVSKESGLWQFVCENNLVDYDTESGWGEFSFNTDYINGFYGKHIFESNYQYRLIESALCDEDKLEEFLLNSIKLD